MLKNSTEMPTCENATIGEKLRQCRKDAKLTMQYVADNAGLSVGFISQVERGLSVPSLSSLRSISAVLQRPISQFLEQPESNADTTREKDRISYKVGEGSLAYERLSAQFPGSTLRSVIIHEAPGQRTEAMSHDGEELFFILQGEVTVELDGQTKILRQGDSMHFDSRRNHSTWNHTSELSSILWCGTMDVFGDATRDPIHKHNDSK